MVKLSSSPGERTLLVVKCCICMQGHDVIRKTISVQTDPVILHDSLSAVLVFQLHINRKHLSACTMVQ